MKVKTKTKPKGKPAKSTYGKPKGSSGNPAKTRKGMC